MAKKDNRGSLSYYYLSLIILIVSVFLICTIASHRLYTHMRAKSAFCAACLNIASQEFPDTDAMERQAEAVFILNRPEAVITGTKVQRTDKGFTLYMTGTIGKTGFVFGTEYIGDTEEDHRIRSK